VIREGELKMIFLLKFLAVLCIGAVVAFIVYSIYQNISSSVKQFSVAKKKKRVLTQESYFKVLMVHIEANPKSREGFYVKLLVGFIVGLLAQLFTGKLIFSILSFIVSFVMTGRYFSKRAKNRLDKFEDQLIEGIGMITNSVKAGLSILQAIEDMVKNTKPPLSTEFGEALRQIKLGTPANQALVDITRRVPSGDLRIVIMSINIARDTGGNIAEMLSRLAAVMRERKKIQGKIDALTSQGRTSGYIMAGVPFLLMGVLYFLEPEMMGLLFTTLIGNLMLVVAIGMVSLGMFVINKIVAIDI